MNDGSKEAGLRVCAFSAPGFGILSFRVCGSGILACLGGGLKVRRALLLSTVQAQRV